ncbi:MAG TPA: hypothetical protein VMV18_06875 [bacterium]|nr:hypothetical protein [bacterium]
MRTLVLLAAALSLTACMRGDDSRRRHVEDEVRRLADRVEELENDNARLRARVDALEAARGGGSADASLPPPAPIHARCKADGDHYQLSAAELDEVFTNTSGLATEMRLVPYFDGGAAKGFKLFGIRSDTLVASCGFHNGDVLQAVNGTPLTTPDKALDAYTRVKNAPSLDFTVLRNGASLDLVIKRR